MENLFLWILGGVSLAVIVVCLCFSMRDKGFGGGDTFDLDF